ncbi:unnamed protein product [Candidula unifasciata]|uniref:BTB domain-containing protein n=1 Tax=Candidula unifasciata TaxID=100452 RepID=A0A8S3ZA60_9EUPU|nr:unnamed protein product [Candidula unifasciata]
MNNTLATLVKINADGKSTCSEKTQVSSYKEVLKQYIPYFHAMFSDNFKESSKTLIELGDDTDFQAVSKLTSFVYKGTLQVEAADIQSVYEVADQWGMTGIASICSQFMIRELDASNCLNLFHLAQMHSCQELIKACLLVFSQQFQAVSLTSSFLQLPSHTLSRLLQLDDINAGLPSKFSPVN